mmetsp:Transcript_4634/g.11781  ORF Transcript_4634/g.11781 Transcript_4634/m.11781 type:complete len:208 (+) Transcript_4634:2583-3206(+)
MSSLRSRTISSSDSATESSSAISLYSSTSDSSEDVDGWTPSFFSSSLMMSCKFSSFIARANASSLRCFLFSSYSPSLSSRPPNDANSSSCRNASSIPAPLPDPSAFSSPLPLRSFFANNFPDDSDLLLSPSSLIRRLLGSNVLPTMECRSIFMKPRHLILGLPPNDNENASATAMASTRIVAAITLVATIMTAAAAKIWCWDWRGRW